MPQDVFINQTASYLPFEAVKNDEIETVLGMVGGKPSRARRIVLRSNGIVSRHYALDRTTGRAAISNAQMTAEAIRRLNIEGSVDVLASGTTSPDQLAPNHAVMVHGELGWPRLEVFGTAGICIAGLAAVKHAWLSVKAGGAERAVASGSELLSPQLTARHFEAESDHQIAALEGRPEIAFEKDFLRWMLSDGAGAWLLEDKPADDLALKIHWIDMSSAAHELPVCMYAGGEKQEDNSLLGWRNYESTDWATRSMFSLRQDVRLLDENIVRTCRDHFALCIKKYDLQAKDIDWFLPHISSSYFAEPMGKALKEVGLDIDRERWFTNLTTVGNIGAASPFVMLDELWRSGRIEKGHKLLVLVPESGRFSSGWAYLEAV